VRLYYDRVTSHVPRPSVQSLHDVRADGDAHHVSYGAGVLPGLCRVGQAGQRAKTQPEAQRVLFTEVQSRRETVRERPWPFAAVKQSGEWPGCCGGLVEAWCIKGSTTPFLDLVLER